jgi:signal transduction histidine kinase
VRLRAIPTGNAALICIMAAVALFVATALILNEKSQADLLRWYAAREHTQATLAAITEQESSLRGYVATGNRRFLDLYRQEEAPVERGFAQLSADGKIAAFGNDVAAWRQLHQRWVAQVAVPLVAARSGPRATALMLQGQTLRDSERALVVKMGKRVQGYTATIVQAQRLVDIVKMCVRVAVVLFGVLAVYFERQRRNEVMLLTTELEKHNRILTGSIDELENQRADVIHINQLKNDMISVLAHDIKGPLTSVLGFAELIEEGALEGEEARAAAGTIRKSATRLTALANDTLAMSRIEFGELEVSAERVDVAMLVRDLVAHMDTTRIVTVRADGDTSVQGDPDRLRQVFENIIRNALKYSPGDVRIRIVGSGGFVRTDVIDTGIGIPADEIPALFQRFSRASNAKNAFSGTGIGLFLVKSLVEKHGGSVDVVSKLNEGSTFTVTLPKEAKLREAPRIAVVATDATAGPFVVYELRSRGYSARLYETMEELVSARAAEGTDAVIVAGDGARDAAGRLRESVSPEIARKVVVLERPFLAADLHAAVDGRLSATGA